MSEPHSVADVLELLARLKAAKVHYELGHHRDEAIMIKVAVPGERWEIEFLDDGTIAVEVFRSDGHVKGVGALDDLFRRHSDGPQGRRIR